LCAQAAGLESAADELRQREASLTEELEQLERERVDKHSAQQVAEDSFTRQREAVAALQAECRSVAQRIGFLRQEIDERHRRLSKVELESARTSEQLVRLDEATEGDARLQAQCEEELAGDRAAAGQLEADIVTAKGASAAASEHVESRKSALIDLATEEAEARNTQMASIKAREQAVKRWQQLRSDLVTADERLAAAEHAAAALRSDVESLRGNLRSTQGEKEERAERVRTLSQQLRERERRVADLEHLVVQSRSRLQYLEEVQRNYEGYQKGVRSILLDEQRAEGVIGVVADVLGVPAEHERAVAAALGDRLQYVIVRGEYDGADAVTKLRSSDAGRGSFIPLSPRPIPLSGPGAASMNGNTRRLLDVVHVDERYRSIAESLLGEVVLVPDLGEGLALWRRNGVHVTMVTPEGDVIDATGVITGGSERPLEEEMVSRQRLVVELASDIEACDTNLGREKDELSRLAAELQSENTTLAKLDEETHALTLRVVAAEKDAERLSDEIPRWLDRVEVSAFEARTIAGEVEELDAELVRVEQCLQSLITRRQSLDTALAEAVRTAAAAAGDVEGLVGELTALQVRVAQRQQRLEAVIAAAHRLKVQREELVARAATLGNEEAQTKDEHRDLCEKLEQSSARMVQEESDYQAADKLLPEVQQKLQEAAEILQASDARCRVLRTELDEVRRGSGQTDVALAERRLRIENVEQSMREKYGLNLREITLGDDADESQEEDLGARLESARGRLLRIGEVSVGAIDELRELEERAEFLRTQKNDLEASIADLERTIQKLNRASKTRFAETFAEVNEKFQEIFPRLFRGGEARLVLTDESNMLETGVEIVVRPPGKRLDTVTLLSGGEKALVAVSLLFSLFLINPTPFCFLDEIDAPLDDANIGRFTQLLREMSAHSQFIVITHNKRTMQAADILYGVTMQEPGISKVISVATH